MYLYIFVSNGILTLRTEETVLKKYSIDPLFSSFSSFIFMNEQNYIYFVLAWVLEWIFGHSKEIFWSARNQLNVYF